VRARPALLRGVSICTSVMDASSITTLPRNNASHSM
jgi:hypothetical protein